MIDLSNYEYLLFDIDDTLLSFEKAEHKALSLALLKVHVLPFKSVLKDYHKINMKYWEMVERNEITRDDCLIFRFNEFLPKYKISMNSHDFENLYRSYLNKQHFKMKNAVKVLKALKKKYKIFSVSNGVLNTQLIRLKQAGLTKYFDKQYISEAIGINKPNVNFFNFIIKDNPELDIKKCLIIGDSLTSDIKLGINANVDTCWLNFKNKVNDSSIKPTYEINSLIELIR